MGRSPCCAKEGLNRGAWTAQEDQILTDFIKIHGPGKWRSLPLRAGLKRCGKSCRLRWLNYLQPGIKRGSFSPDEEDLIIRLHKLLGNRWSLIAGRIPGRTDNEIKNYWNTNLSKKIGAPPSSDKAPKRDIDKGKHAKINPILKTTIPPAVATGTKARRISSNFNPPKTDNINVKDMKSVSQSSVDPPNVQLQEGNGYCEDWRRGLNFGLDDCDVNLDWLKFSQEDTQPCDDGTIIGEHDVGLHGETVLDWLSEQLLEEDDVIMNVDLSSLDCFLDHDQECPNDKKP